MEKKLKLGPNGIFLQCLSLIKANAIMVGQHGDIMVLTQPLKKNSQQVTCG
jgi:hypothetical protein